jgi:hypothetical protein
MRVLPFGNLHIISLVIGLLISTSNAWAEWDFVLADESRIAINVHNLEHKQEFLLDFLPPISGKSLDLEKTDKGVKSVSFSLRGYASEEVDHILVGDETLVTSDRYFIYPITLSNTQSKVLMIKVFTKKGGQFRYRVSLQFTPPESIYTPYHLTYIDVLQTVFNFQFSLTLLSIRSGALSKQSSLAVFPVIGGRLTIEPQFFKWVYFKAHMFSSIFKDPFSNEAEVAFSVFNGYLLGRIPVHAGGDFWLTPELGFASRAHSVIQNTDNIRVGVTSYGGLGVRSAVVIEPNPLFQIIPKLIFYFPVATPFGGTIEHVEAGMTVGFRMAGMYYLGLEYTINNFTVAEVSTYRETYTNFLIHAGTFL